MQRTNISTGAPWEAIVGYSRAVRVGAFVYVTGTIAIDEQGQVIGVDDAYTQTAAAIAKVRAALESLDASLEDVVRTRLYVTDIDQWEEIGRAHREAFGDIMPCTTMVEITRLAAPDAMIEVEADAVISSQLTTHG